MRKKIEKNIFNNINIQIKCTIEREVKYNNFDVILLNKKRKTCGGSNICKE